MNEEIVLPVAPKRAVSAQKRKTTAISDEKNRGGPFLPEEVVFQILVWLPTAVLFNCMSCVCRQWYNIIRTPQFTKEHLLRSKPGFLFHFHSDKYPPSLVNYGESGVADLTEFTWGYPHLIVDSVDGLVLVKHSVRDLYVENLFTKQIIHLPPFHEYLRSSRSKFSLVSGGSDSSYKVFISYYPQGSITIRCAIITVGENRSWKFCDCPNNIYRLHTVRAGRVIYWCSKKTLATYSRRNYRDSSRLLLSFDVESGNFYHVRSPTLDYKEHECECFYMEREKSLSLWIRVQPENVFDLWLMSTCDATTSFAWQKQGTLSFGNDEFYSRMDPVAWVNKGDMVIFRIKKGYFIARNFKNGRTFKLGREYDTGTEVSGFFSEFSYMLTAL